MKSKFFCISFSIIAIAFSLYSCSGSVSPDYGKYESLLKDQMQTMRNVLNGAHYNEFVSQYVDPSYITKVGGVDKVLLQFGSRQQSQMYNALSVARNISPLYNESKKEMTYVSDALVNPLVFKLINGKWYIIGDWFKYQ
ncbi:MAG: hypothetical protein HGGPFJEG_02831 [Ignavibacteria bacterium]|nr:hypothetical protein [Ignavibacteria bacterium]